MTVLLKLAALTGDICYRDAAERALAPIVGVAAQHPTGFAQWLTAYQLASGSIDEVVERLSGLLHGRMEDQGAQQRPFRGLTPCDESDSARFFGRESELAAFVERRKREGGAPTDF